MAQGVVVWAAGVLLALWAIALALSATAAAVVLAPLRLVGRTQRRRRLGAGLCPICSYDLSGITGPCPECGSERNRKA